MKLPPNYVDNLENIVSNASPSITLDRKWLTKQIEALLTAVVAPQTSDKKITLFREAIDARPTSKEFADQFKKIAKAKDPLAVANGFTGALVRLNARAKERWAERLKDAPLNRKYHLLNVKWDELTDWQRDSVREIARELEKEYRTKIVQGAPGKYDHNALLVELANIYLQITGEQIDRFELAHSVNSNFIRFVHAAVEPFYPSTEVTLKALSNRWAQMKDHSKKKSKPIKPVRKKIRVRPNHKE